MFADLRSRCRTSKTILLHLDSCDPVAAAFGWVNSVTVEREWKAARAEVRITSECCGRLERRVALRGSRSVDSRGGGRGAGGGLWRSLRRVRRCFVTARRPAKAAALARVRVWWDGGSAGGSAAGIFRCDRECDAGGDASELLDESPLAANELNTRLVFDTIYRPVVTKLMQLAQRRGIDTVSGLDMFVAQGVAQWEIWTARRAPVATMIREVRGALGISDSRPRATRVTKRK